MNVAVVTNMAKSGEKGGAERYYDGFVNCLKDHGLKITRIDVYCDESNFDNILKSYLKCYDLDLSKYDGVISTKAPTYVIRHPNHICYLMHQVRVFYDMFDEIKHDKENYKRRDLIHRLDTLAFSPNRTQKIFTIGHEVTNRLLKWNGIESEVVYPGISMDGFYSKSYEHIFLPGRLHKWKRVDLLVKSMKYVESPVKLKIAGTGEEYKSLKETADGDPRIELLGYISDEEIKNLYANALVVPFIPIYEDYGYIVHEAFLSKTPVITCIDSGEPTRFVKDYETGFVCEPDPKQIAKYIDTLYNNKGLAKKMGENGYQISASINWNYVAKKMIGGLGGKSE